MNDIPSDPQLPSLRELISIVSAAVLSVLSWAGWKKLRNGYQAAEEKEEAISRLREQRELARAAHELVPGMVLQMKEVETLLREMRERQTTILMAIRDLDRSGR